MCVCVCVCVCTHACTHARTPRAWTSQQQTGAVPCTHVELRTHVDSMWMACGREQARARLEPDDIVVNLKVLRNGFVSDPPLCATHSRDVLPHGRTRELTSGTSRTAPVCLPAAVLSRASTSVDAFESGSTCRRGAASLTCSSCQQSGTSGDPQLSCLFLTSAFVVVQIAQERTSCTVDIFFQLT